MSGSLLDWIGWALAAVNLVGAALLIGGSAAFGRLRPGRWGMADGLLGLLALVWVGIGASAVSIRLATGSFEPGPDLPMGPALAGTAVGALAGAATALLRAGPGPLGLARLSGGWVVVGVLGLGPLMAVTAGWVWAWEQASGPIEEQELLRLIQRGEVPVLAVAIGIYGVVVAPMVEEIVFRGLLLPPFARRLGAPLGILLSSVLFGALHLSDPQAVVPLVLLGSWLGWLRLKSGSLWPAILAHLVNNSLAIAAAFWA